MGIGAIAGGKNAGRGSGAVTVNSAPTAISVGVNGTVQVGQTLTGSHTYSDTDGDLEGVSTFRWFSSDTVDGAYTAIANATASTYTLTSAEAGKYLKFEVTPVALSGTLTGSAVLSGATTAVAAAGTTNVSFTNSADYTLQDAAKAEVVNGVTQLKNTSSNCVIFAFIFGILL